MALLRGFWLALFCALLLLIMILPPTVSVDSNIELEKDDLVISESSSRSASTGALAWEWAQKAGGSGANDQGNAIDVDSNGNVYVTGAFEQTVTFGSTTLTSAGRDDIFVAKMNSTGHWLWAVQAGGHSDDQGMDIAIDSAGNVFLTGKFQDTAYFGSDSMTASHTTNVDLFVAKIDTFGFWQWVEGVDCDSSGYCYGTSVAVDSAGYAYVTGSYKGIVDFGSTTLAVGGVEDIFVAKIDTWGSWQWATKAGGPAGYDVAHSIDIGPNGNVFIAGYFQFTADFGNDTFTTCSNCGSDSFIAKISQQGDWVWTEVSSGNSSSKAYAISVNSQGEVFVAGGFYVSITFGNISYSTGGYSNSFVAKAIDQGNTVAWDWAVKIAISSSDNYAQDMTFDSNGDLMVTGWFQGTASFGYTAMMSSGNKDIYVTKIQANSNSVWAKKAGGGSTDVGLGIAIGPQGNLYTTGYFYQSTISFGNVDIAGGGQDDSFIAKMSSDYDQDTIPDTLDDDDDGDFVLDTLDGCNPSPFGFQSLTLTDHDGDGCRDSDEDEDDDGDGLLDDVDGCPRGRVGWSPDNTTDIDMDGCFDATEDFDDDGDGYEDYIDLCPRLEGNSTYDYEEGCPDSDGDGRADIKDIFPGDENETHDSDGDGVGNNSDAFPNDPTQTLNIDGDDYGDNAFGNLPDACPDEYGTSVIDVYGCLDSDGDGVSDIYDRFKNNPALWQDTDNDGIDDGNDSFPFNPTQTLDFDGDGFGDNLLGSNADRFVNDETQWSDVDGDGYGDNPDGNMSDAFPLDPTQWMDSDGDGHGDNPGGSIADAFPNDPTQWLDEDNDGLGDNPNGNNPDPYLFDSDNDGYNNSIDPLPFLPTPGDLDNDGWLDDEDWDPYDITEWADWDGDGIGDNEDIDDDNDNWDDWTEMREGTDSHNPNDHPVDSFEIPITENIALSAWDLLMLLAGLPLASWLIFGFVTRNGRTDIFEERMRDAKTRRELEGVATEYERALMLRLIGPHQGIRLERVRAELDDEIEMSEAELTGEDDDLGPVVTTPDQTDYTEEELGMQPSEDSEIIDDGKGYEWVDEGEEKWYRPVDGSSWTKWET